jgi:hypothetical protein
MARWARVHEVAVTAFMGHERDAAVGFRQPRANPLLLCVSLAMSLANRVVFSVLLSGGAIAAFAVAACDRRSDASESAPPAVPGELRVTASEHGFTPSSLSIPKGAPGSLAAVTFVRVSDQTCATEVVFPELDLKKPLPLNTPVHIDVPSDVARTLTFQCGMAMYKGAVLVK